MATKNSKKKEVSFEDEYIVKWVTMCREEASEAKQDRMDMNEDNYNMYHLRHNFDHKEEGQSCEVLSKQPMAVEQISSFFQQALIDSRDWFRVVPEFESNEELMKVRPHEMKKLMERHMEKTGYYSHVGNSVKSALLGAVKVSKVHGKMCPNPKFVVSKKKKGKGKKSEKVLEKIDKKSWSLKTELVRQENFYPDPTGANLYEIEDMWIDYHMLKKMSEGDWAIYDKSIVNEVVVGAGGSEDNEDQWSKSRETGQNTTKTGHRKRVKLTEYWGDILDEDGDVLFENVVCTIAEDKWLIRKPTPNPLWHQKSPYNSAPLIEVPGSVWHKALMDAPTKHNQALNEIYNLILDGAMKSVNAISQVRASWLEDPSQVEDGIKPGDALRVNDQCPPGAKVAEPVITADVPNDGLNVLNIVQQEFNSSALTSDLRQGITPDRQVKATAIVEASQTITSIFQGVVKNFEKKALERELELIWLTIAQNWDRLNEDEFVAMFGEERGKLLAELDPEDVFEATAKGIKFKVFGISMIVNKGQDFRKYTTLLQTIGGAPVLLEEFVKKYSLGNLMEEIMTSLGVEKDKIELPEIQQEANRVQREEDQGQESFDQGEASPDQMSQVPQAQALSLEEILGGGIPQSQFPESRATPVGS